MKKMHVTKVINESKYAIVVLSIELLVSVVQIIPMIPNNV